VTWKHDETMFVEIVESDDTVEALEDARPRKKHVLHTRVPAVLEDELKRLATSLRLPVSNLVRAILEDAVDAVDAAAQKAEGGLRGFGDRLHDERERLRERVRTATAAKGAGEAPSDPLAGVVGYQPLVLAAEARCAKCGRTLAAGEDAFLGVGGAGPGPVIVGRECAPGRKGS